MNWLKFEGNSVTKDFAFGDLFGNLEFDVLNDCSSLLLCCVTLC